VSIDAVIQSVKREPDGTAALILVTRDPRTAPAGQSRLTVVNPPPFLEAAVGTEVWGGCGALMVGDTEWADRIGYTRIRLITDRWRFHGTTGAGEWVYRCSQCGRVSEVTEATCPDGCGVRDAVA
jgi:hypothetical protein